MNWPNDFINKIICGDCLETMKQIPAEAVDMVMTSPPYWGLRDYGTGPDQLGLEPTPELYIEHLTEIFNEAKRVLKKEGTLWLNIGDTYSANRSYQVVDNKWKDVGNYMPMSVPSGLQPKCLLMIPERLAWALIQDGWILRNKIIWYKPNAMPSSARDRFSNRWEYLFFFSKSRRYFFDLNAVKIAHKESATRWGGNTMKVPKGQKNMQGLAKGLGSEERAWRNPAGKNPGDFFEINTQPFPDAHFAVFPEKLCEKPIKAGCPKDGIVLDPFAGAGTALFVAQQLKRRFIGIDIKKEYCELAEKRLAQGVL